MVYQGKKELVKSLSFLLLYVHAEEGFWNDSLKGRGNEVDGDIGGKGVAANIFSSISLGQNSCNPFSSTHPKPQAHKDRDMFSSLDRSWGIQRMPIAKVMRSFRDVNQFHVVFAVHGRGRETEKDGVGANTTASWKKHGPVACSTVSANELSES